MTFDPELYRQEHRDRMAAERLDVLERTCSVRGCRRLEWVTLTGPFGDRGFCRSHAPVYLVHYRIVRDILTL